ncbi:MAG: proline dehydrogenase family protein [Planctomycetota bacterium]|nr:proline dehydrogenase family protein [Planctomycetota bacterium]
MEPANAAFRQELETEIQSFGLDLWKRISGEVPGLFNKDYWQGLVLEWAMRDVSFKTDMFRLVDVLPSLSSSDQVAEHVRGFLLREGRELPAVLGAAVKMASAGITAGLAARAIRGNVAGMAERFIIGTDAGEAIPLLRRFRKEGLAFTVDLLGETTVSDVEAAVYEKRYEDLIDRLSDEVKGWPPNELLDRDHTAPLPRANVSLKISALCPFLDAVDPAGSVERLRRRILPLLQRAREKGVFVNLDLEHRALHRITFDLFESLALDPALRDWPHFGAAVQAYLKDSRQDIERVISLARRRGAPLTVRLVKGAYWEYEVAQAQQLGYPCPVFTDKAATDANYEALTALLLENVEHVRTAVASHNLRSLAYALVLARKLKLPPGALELQMLNGMAEPERKAFCSLGQRVRVYCPVGELLPGVAYLVRRLLENTSNSGFLRLSHHDNVDIRALLKAPEPAGGRDTPAPLRTGAKRMVSGDPSSPYDCCPLTDFNVAAVQAAFAGAVANVRAALPVSVPVVIDGKDRSGGTTQERLCPNDGETLVARVAMATPEEAERAAEAAWAGWPAWRDRPLRERAVLLDRLADELERDRYELAAMQVWEVGKPWREADADVAEAIDFCHYYARQALLELSARKCLCLAGEDNTLLYEGRGPAVIISPWNFPLAILTGMSTAALVAGNTVILKPSGLSSTVAYGLYQRMIRAGIPPQVVQFVPGSGEKIGTRLVEHPLVAQIAFTGGKDVGLGILERAARVKPGQRQVKRVVCEMGGKNAIIVDDDADLDEAVTGVLKSAFGFAGQKCSACSRVLVVGSAYEAFVRRLVEACRSLTMASAAEPGCQVPPVIDSKAQQRLLGVIEAPGPGAKLLFKAQAPPKGCFVPPTVFEVENDRHRLMQEELFGPVVALMKADSFSKALDVAMGTEFFLTGGVFSRLPSHLEEARARFRVGNLYLNRGCTGAVVGRQPFGGSGMSGLGTKAGGPGYLLLFADPRVVCENTMRRGMAPELEA